MKRWEREGLAHAGEERDLNGEVPIQESQRQKIIAEPRDVREVRERLHLSPVSSMLNKNVSRECRKEEERGGRGEDVK